VGAEVREPVTTGDLKDRLDALAATVAELRAELEKTQVVEVYE